jgi:hypothetical protein
VESYPYRGSTSSTFKAMETSFTVRVVRRAARIRRRASMMTWPMRYSTSWDRAFRASSLRELMPTDSATSLTLSEFQRSFGLGTSFAMAGD